MNANDEFKPIEEAWIRASLTEKVYEIICRLAIIVINGMRDEIKISAPHKLSIHELQGVYSEFFSKEEMRLEVARKLLIKLRQKDEIIALLLKEYGMDSGSFATLDHDILSVIFKEQQTKILTYIANNEYKRLYYYQGVIN